MTPGHPQLRLSLVGAPSPLHTELSAACAALPLLKVLPRHGDPEQALREVPRLAPDVVLLHLRPTVLAEAVALTMRLREQLPHLGLVFVDPEPDPARLAILARAHAGWACVAHAEDPAGLERAIIGAAAGLIVLDAELSRTLPLPPSLAPRRELVELLVQGYCLQAIAMARGQSERSLEGELAELYRTVELTADAPGGHPRVRLVRWLLERCGHRTP